MTRAASSFVVRWFLALHATVPAAVLVAVLVHLWPPAGLPPLAQAANEASAPALRVPGA